MELGAFAAAICFLVPAVPTHSCQSSILKQTHREPLCASDGTAYFSEGPGSDSCLGYRLILDLRES
jgi:hypothetical protein